MYRSPVTAGRLLDLGNTLKRKIGYEEEEIRSTRDRLARMDIDKATEGSPSRGEVI
jgi:hypothetical protein